MNGDKSRRLPQPERRDYFCEDEDQNIINITSPFLFSSIYGESQHILLQDYIYHYDLSQYLKLPYVRDESMESKPQLLGPVHTRAFSSYLDRQIAKHIKEDGPLCFLPLAQRLCTVLCDAMALYNETIDDWHLATEAVVKQLSAILTPAIVQKLSNLFDFNQMLQYLLFYTPVADTSDIDIYTDDMLRKMIKLYCVKQNTFVLSPTLVEYFNQQLFDTINNVQIPTSDDKDTIIDSDVAVKHFDACLYVVAKIFGFSKSFRHHIPINYNIMIKLIELIKSLIQYVSNNTDTELSQLGIREFDDLLLVLHNIIYDNLIYHLNKTSSIPNNINNSIPRDDSSMVGGSIDDSDDDCDNDDDYDSDDDHDDNDDDDGAKNINDIDDGVIDIISNEFDILSFPSTAYIDDDYNNNNTINNTSNILFPAHLYQFNNNKNKNIDCWITLWNDFLVLLTQDNILIRLSSWEDHLWDPFDDIMPIFLNALKDDVDTLYKGIVDVDTLYKGIHQYKVNNIIQPIRRYDDNQDIIPLTSNNKQGKTIIPLISSSTKLKIIQWFNNLFHICNNDDDNTQTLDIQQDQQQQQHHEQFSKHQRKRIRRLLEKRITKHDYHLQMSLYVLQLYILYQHIFINPVYPSESQHKIHSSNAYITEIEEHCIIPELFKLIEQKSNNHNTNNNNNRTIDNDKISSPLSNLDYIQLSVMIDYFVHRYTPTNNNTYNSSNTSNNQFDLEHTNIINQLLNSTYSFEQPDTDTDTDTDTDSDDSDSD